MGEDKEVLISDSGQDELDMDINDYPSSSTREVCDNLRNLKISHLPVPVNSVTTGSNNLNESQSSGRQAKLISATTNLRNTLQRRLPTAASATKAYAEIWRFHWRALVSSFLTVISSAGCLILFPMHLESTSRNRTSDGYSACLSVTSITTLFFLLSSLALKLFYRSSERIFAPMISWKSIIKIGFSVGLSVLTLFYSWEDHKVMCNFQDPLLGLVVIFAIITHAVSKWKSIGFKRTFALTTIAAGVFVSVDYPLVDHHRCRGHYYSHQLHDPWTWKVHLVWTLAFVVSIWLWTVAMFCIESSIPLPKIKHKRLHEGEYNAVKMTVIRIKSSMHDSVPADDPNSEPDLYSSNSKPKNYRHNPYSTVPFTTVNNAILWFAISTWCFIASLFWTEFIPGFGKGIAVEHFPGVIVDGFYKLFTTGTSWWLVISLYVFAQAFTYLLLLVRSPMIAISVGCLGFPIVGLWWSFFQIKYNFFVWMPVFSGELICAFLGLPMVFGGTYCLYKLDVLNPAKVLTITPTPTA